MYYRRRNIVITCHVHAPNKQQFDVDYTSGLRLRVVVVIVVVIVVIVFILIVVINSINIIPPSSYTTLSVLQPCDIITRPFIVHRLSTYPSSHTVYSLCTLPSECVNSDQHACLIISDTHFPDERIGAWQSASPPAPPAPSTFATSLLFSYMVLAFGRPVRHCEVRSFSFDYVYAASLSVCYVYVCISVLRNNAKNEEELSI